MKSIISFTLKTTLLIGCLLFTGLAAGNSQAFSNKNALRGLDESHVYFDINTGDPNKLVLRLELLHRTVVKMRDEGVAVTAIAGIRGNASRFLTSGSHYVLEEDSDKKEKIRQWVTRLSEEGIRMEQCSIAADLLGIEYKDFLPELTVVDNGYISLIGYQHQGYAVVPMD